MTYQERQMAKLNELRDRVKKNVSKPEPIAKTVQTKSYEFMRVGSKLKKVK